jgi:hypothetical protein
MHTEDMASINQLFLFLLELPLESLSASTSAYSCCECYEQKKANSKQDSSLGCFLSLLACSPEPVVGAKAHKMSFMAARAL